MLASADVAAIEVTTTSSTATAMSVQSCSCVVPSYPIRSKSTTPTQRRASGSPRSQVAWLNIHEEYFQHLSSIELKSAPKRSVQSSTTVPFSIIGLDFAMVGISAHLQAFSTVEGDDHDSVHESLHNVGISDDQTIGRDQEP